MSQRKADQQWARPKQTRRVWIKGADRFTAPTQGYVVAWRRQSYRWAALVVHVVDERIVQEWMPAEDLAPVRPTPAELLRVPLGPTSGEDGKSDPVPRGAPLAGISR